MSYKYGHLVAHCVDSIVSQTEAFDVIRVYDDGVGDCGHIRELYPDVEVIERPQNLGTTKNFQDALERTNTDYVMFIGADNWLRQDGLALLKGQKFDIINYNIALTGTESKEFAQKVTTKTQHDGYSVWEFKENVTPAMMSGTNYIHGSALYNVKLAKECGYTQQGNDGNPQEDWGLFRKMIDKGATYKLIPEPLLFYRRHRENFIQS